MLPYGCGLPPAGTPPTGGERKAATARFPPRSIAAAAYAANMPLACLLTLRRRKNTLRGASVESFATRGPRRSPAKRVRWGEEAQRSERRLPLCGGRRDTELVPTTRRAQRIPFGGKGVSLFRQFKAAPAGRPQTILLRPVGAGPATPPGSGRRRSPQWPPHPPGWPAGPPRRPGSPGSCCCHTGRTPAPSGGRSRCSGGR